MICIDGCSICKHIRDEKIDGWISTCDAFPNGIPLDFMDKNVTKMPKCNNGIGYEPDEKYFDIAMLLEK